MSGRVQIPTRRLCAFAAILAFAAFAALVVRMRPIAWKLADETFCLADWEGFREAALPGLWPGGALRWISSILMTTGLVDGWCWVPYLLLPLLLACAVVALNRKRPRATPFRVCVAPFMIVLVSLYQVGTRIWQLPDYAFPMTNLLGMCVVVALFAALRGRPWLVGGACAVGYVPFGLYAPLAGVLELLDEMACAGFRRWRALAVAAALLATTPWAAASFVYGDVAVGLSVGYSQSILNGALLEPLGFWSVASFALFACEMLGVGRFVGKRPWGQCLPYVPWGLLLCAGVFAWTPPEDLRPQFRMERFVREGRYDEALAANARDPVPMRMSLAYRVLALWRTGRLESDLFARPFTSFHRTSPAEEMKMDGQDLLFDYGLLMPARQRTMECVCAKGWQPGHLRLMGDAAFLTGERALALRDWRQLARCPFRGGFARRRLEGLKSGKGLGDPAFADLRPVAELHVTWCDVVERRSEPPFYFMRDENAENFINGRLLTVKGQPPPEVARLILAVYLLEKDAKALVASRGIMDALCPEGPWPRVWQQGVLAHLGTLTPDERDALVATLRSGVFTADEAERFDRFVADAQGLSTNGVDMLARYGDTYYFYDAFVK